jgi:type I restriction enzyme R subunit
LTTGYITEDMVEQAALELLRDKLGYATASGPVIAPDGDTPERASYRQVVLEGRLRSALARINPHLPGESINQVVRRVTAPETPQLLENNRIFHRYLTAGVAVEFRDRDEARHGLAWLVDFENLENNDWLAVNQFRVEQDQHHRRPDMVIFVNGLPLAIIELKNPADQNATVEAAYHQLQTYKGELSLLFQFNEVLVVSDGAEARAGTISAPYNWFLPWKSIHGEPPPSEYFAQLDVLLEGIFEHRRFLDILQNFVFFEDERTGTVKKLAAYHQYHAANKAIAATREAAGPQGDKRIGVVWHTQGSGKSLSMVCFTGKIARDRAMQNPTVVMLTDRNDLDNQLFGVFGACRELLRQEPVQAETRAQLRQLLKREAGGVIFTTIQKFMPEERGDSFPQLSDRRNIIVVADEAHRSQYDFIDGLARHLRDALPNASFIGFTGTPIEAADRNTPAVFGDYIDVYDIQRAVEDGATVRIYYENRLVQIELDPLERETIDDEVVDLTEGEEEEAAERIKRKWAAVEKLVGTEKRIQQVAEDIVQHWEKRLEILTGKAMIVCMSRRICVDLYNAIIKLRSQWHDLDDKKGVLKVVMTGSATDPLDWQQHVRNKPRRQELADRFKDPNDQFRIAIVRDMWLTGFDCPALHTMYVDKPMRGHGLMQAIARVNRVFRDKPGGLIVDYIGLAADLKNALSDYTRSGGRGRPNFDQEEAVALMKDKYEIVLAMFHGFDLPGAVAAPASQKTVSIVNGAQHILQLPPDARERSEDRKKRYLESSTALKRAFALSVPHEEAIAIRDEVGYMLAVAGLLNKVGTSTGGPTQYDVDTAISQLISRAVVPQGVIDVFAEAGIDRPDISLLSEEFLEEVRHLPQRNLAAEALQRLLADQIRVRMTRNAVQARKFSEMLEASIRRYQNRSIEAAQVILELIELAREMREADKRGEDLGLSQDELAFYDALA